MQAPWDWIRQRPHFLAESLSAGHDVTVVSATTLSPMSSSENIRDKRRFFACWSFARFAALYDSCRNSNPFKRL
jgi:hypothetical protein